VRNTLPELFNEFLCECEFARKLRPQTLRGTREAFKLLLKLVPDLSLQNISPGIMTRFFRILDERKRIGKDYKIITGVKKSTVRTYWSKLYPFFEWLRIRKHIRVNPLNDMRRPSVTWDDLKYLKRQDIERILAAIHNPRTGELLLMKRNLAMFYTLLYCGLRREELITLHIRDIDFERKLLTVRAENSKIPRTRHIPLHSQAIMYLKDYLKERKSYTTPFLFVSRHKDTMLSRDGLTDIVKTLNMRSGVKFHLHQFRHTFAVNFLKTSNNIAKLKQLLGHTDIKMTMVYLRCLPTDELRGDVENMRLDDFV
jgi:integrase/recombinase XerD